MYKDFLCDNSNNEFTDVTKSSISAPVIVNNNKVSLKEVNNAINQEKQYSTQGKKVVWGLRI